MNVESAEVELAYTYAWWLTGDDRAARTAVMTAVDRPDIPGADPMLRLEILLRRVRAAAVSAPTMCPASELALLHDAIGLGLDSAAGLAMIDAREARTELAHGRLEALGPEADFEVVEPERLGGLAVGNPADVAAARQNPQLGVLREMILRGRDELVDVSRVTVPADLLDAVANRRPGPIDETPMEEDWFDVVPPEAPADDVAGDPGDEDEDEDDADDAAGVGSADDELDGAGAGAPADASEPRDEPTAVGAMAGDVVELDTTEEIDLSSAGSGSTAEAGRQPRRRWGWAALALMSIAALAVLLVTQIGFDGDPDDASTDVAQRPGAPADQPAADPTDADPTDDEGAVATATDIPSDPATAGPTAEPTATETVGDLPDDPGTFVVSGSGAAVGIGGDPSPDNPIAGPFEPVSITVEYTGAVDGDALEVDWMVDGEPYDTERAALSPLLETARFTKQVPDEGWPVGQHVLVLVLERTGETVGEVRFQVQDDTA